MPRVLAAAALLAVLPSAAQAPAAQTPAPQQTAATPSAAAGAEIDPALVGRWTLVEVEDEGQLAAFDAEIQAMACQFGADGEASIGVTVEQDADAYTRERMFRFVTDSGMILADGAGSARYEMLGADELRLTMDDGLIVRLTRAGT